MWEKITQQTLAGMELWRVLAFFAVLLGTMIFGRIVKFIFSRMGAKSESEFEPIQAAFFNALARSFPHLIAAFGFKFATKFVSVTEDIEKIVDGGTSTLVVVAVGYMAFAIVDVVDVWIRVLSSRTSTKMDDMLAPLVRKSLRVTIVVFTLLQIATVLSDKPITSLLAGLGIGGLAVALAAQDTIKHFFGSLLILGDKPFELGDRVIVGDIDGPVEEVGFRSTRIRTLDGNLVSIPNGDLANKSIINVNKRPSIRRIMNIGVTYDTPPEKVERAVQIVKDVLENHEGMKEDFPPRVYFNDFKDFSLNIFAIYWYHPPDWWEFCAFGEQVNMEILKRFNAEGIEFAFPTQTMFLAGDENRPLKVQQG